MDEKELKFNSAEEPIENKDFSENPDGSVITADSDKVIHNDGEDLHKEDLIEDAESTDNELKDSSFDSSDLQNDKTSNEDSKPLSDNKKTNTEKAEKNNSKTKKKSRKNSKKKKSKVNNSIFGGVIVVTVVLTISIVIAIKGITLGMEYLGVGKSENSVSFNIPQGADNSEIAKILEENGIIENQSLFKLAIKIRKPNALYPGDITLKPSMGYTAVIEELAKMRKSYETVTVTIPEGANLLTVAKLLEKNKVCSAEDFLFEFNKDQGFVFENNIQASKDAFYRMEGYFVPNTYEFYVGDTAYNITKKIREQFEKTFTDDMYKKVEKSGYSLNQVITIASIVQLEAESTEQMPKVASVFLNRLNDADTYPMLQSDTTKNYVKKVIKTQSDNQASIEHYTKCYDTYQCKGLPAGPICNPSIDAINAVLNPAKTDYYYFCNNLKTKKTYYAKTLEEHEKNLKAAGLTK